MTSEPSEHNRAVEAAQLTDLEAGRPTVLYDVDTPRLTTWPGTPTLRVLYRTNGRRMGGQYGPWHYVSIRAIDAHGREWYGRRSSESQAVVMRLAKGV